MLQTQPRKTLKNKKAFPKTCTCCGLRYTEAQWSKLPTPRAGGVQDDGFAILQLRNCPCTGTMAIEAEFYL